MRDSPSKTTKIVLRYISNMPDVGSPTLHPPVTYQSLVEIAKTLNKSEVWDRSDLRLIFTLPSVQATEEVLVGLNTLISCKQALFQ